MHRREFIKKTISSTSVITLGSFASVFSNSLSIAKKRDLDDYDLLIPRVKYQTPPPDEWNIFPEGEQNLLKEFSRIFECKVKLQKAYRRWGKPEEFNAIVDFENFPTSYTYPFVFITGSRHYKLSQQDKGNLKRYIEKGGFVLLDDCVLRHKEDFFFQSSHELLTELFGTDFREIKNEHTVFHNVFDLDEGLPYIQGVNHPAFGVFIKGRLCAFLSSTDIHCGWIGRFFNEKEKHEKAVKMGINVLFYALTN